MKKYIAILMACIAFITSITSINATYHEDYVQPGFVIEFNGEQTEYKSIVHNNIHYVPLRTIFEKLGASVFYRERDCQILALSRDGDLIKHIIGENRIVINGEEKTFEYTSLLNNDGTYIPIEMVSTIFSIDDIFYDSQQLIIKKHFYNNDYHRIIQDVLEVCRYSNFYPERFQRYISYHINNPDCSIQEVLFKVNLGLDYRFYENVTTIEQPYELLVLVNKYNQLPAGFRQYNLVNMNQEHTYRDGKQYLLAAVAYENYIKMSDAAKKDGISIRVISAYRTEDYQRRLYNSKVRARGIDKADKYSARPGSSEHQTGLAIDISCTQATFEYTAEFKWLNKHAHEYGFILRYPKGKEWITGYSYEPWHFRYVGTDVARIIYEEGITFEEYYAKYISENEFR